MDRLIALARGLTPQSVPLSKIREFDEPFWSSGYERPPSGLDIAMHARLIDQADVGFPIILSGDGRAMDGMHRVVKALRNGPTGRGGCAISRWTIRAACCGAAGTPSRRGDRVVRDTSSLFVVSSQRRIAGHPDVVSMSVRRLPSPYKEAR